MAIAFLNRDARSLLILFSDFNLSINRLGSAIAISESGGASAIHPVF